MKFTIDRAVLSKALEPIQGTIKRGNVIPVLEGVSIESTDDGRLLLTGTNLDLSVESFAAANVEEPGRILPNFSTLHEIVRRLPDGSEISFETTGEFEVVIRCGRSRFTVQCMDTNDFPNAGRSDYQASFDIVSGDLKRLFDHTRFAMSSEETRYYLCGVYFHVAEIPESNVLRAVATDGHRLARVDSVLPEGAENMPAIIIPREAVGLMRKMLDDVAGPVRIEVSTSKFRLSANDRVLTTKLIDGQFPDYNRVIPTGNGIVARYTRKDLLEAVARVSSVNTEKTKSVTIEVKPEGSVLIAKNPNAGEAYEEIDSELEGDPISIGFNARYIVELVDQIDDDTVEISFGDSVSPALFRAPDADDVFVLMPMRV